MRAVRSLEYLVGTGSNIPFYILVFRPAKSLALNGGRLAANSYMIHPRDHISHED